MDLNNLGNIGPSLNFFAEVTMYGCVHNGVIRHVQACNGEGVGHTLEL
jgi:hypothetical protein